MSFTGIYFGWRMAEEPDVCSKVSKSVKIAGFLDKKGSMLWKRYWFVLEDHLLLYYRSQLEYLNLSPCRGSLNMALVSSVQPRRNSRDPIIHIVSRSTTLILKVHDQETQAKWLQSLLESIGKGLSPHQHLSCENLPSQLNPLPHSRHSGSLDIVWRNQMTPPTRLKAEASAGHGINSAGDTRHSTLGRIRTALRRRPSSTDPSTRMPKRHRESFLNKIIGKSRVKNDVEEVNELEAEVEKVHKPEVDKVTEPESEEDPFYDTIGSNSNSLTAFKPLLPGDTMDELKIRLAAKEKAKSKESPPALPPRQSLSSNALNCEENIEESEESDISGHYQVIRKPVIDSVINTNFGEALAQEVVNTRTLTEEEKNAMYSIPKSKSIESSGAFESLTPSTSKETQISEDTNHNLIEKTGSSKIEMDTKDGIEMLIKELKELECDRNHNQNDNKTTICLPEDDIKEDNRKVTTLFYECNQGSNEPLIIEIRHDPNEAAEKTYNDDEGVTAFREESLDEEDGLECSETIKEIDNDLKEESTPALEVTPTLNVAPTTEASSDTVENDNIKQDSENDSPEVALIALVQQTETSGAEDIVLQFQLSADSLSTKELPADKENKELRVMDDKVNDLSLLLQKLTELTLAPLLTSESEVGSSPTKNNVEDPDYDIPRPHSAVANMKKEDLERLPPTEFFTKVEEDACSSGHASVEPDSLESKKEFLMTA